jgi:hypothetical protein
LGQWKNRETGDILRSSAEQGALNRGVLRSRD